MRLVLGPGWAFSTTGGLEGAYADSAFPALLTGISGVILLFAVFFEQARVWFSL